MKPSSSPPDSQYPIPISRYFDLQFDKQGCPFVAIKLRGMAVLKLASTNKGTAFTQQERQALGLEGLLPPHISNLELKVDRLYRSFQLQTDDLAKYQFLRGLQDRDEVVFYALLKRNLSEMMPIIYTPTVGKAVQQFSTLYQTPRGITLSKENIDRADQIMHNYTWGDVRMIVATDSSAILGIGDQGHNGLAICIGKLALYTAGGGVSPFHTMPVNLDVGTDRKDLLEDKHYLGIKHQRLRGEDYFKLLDQFVASVKKAFPKAVIQWEDFSKNTAFEVLERYQNEIPSFNDDIQGTGAVILAGLLTACRIKKESLCEQRIAIVGAGAAGVGVAKVILDGLVREGLSKEQARQQVFLMDARGLVVKETTPDQYKLPAAQSADVYKNWSICGKVPQLMEVVEHAKITTLIGLTGIRGLFNQPIIEGVLKNHPRPIIFPLSNPNSNCEALPSDVITWTNGKAIIACGSPFDDVIYNDQTITIGQGNNAFIFPGLGFAAILGGCQMITDTMVLESAYALADYTNETHLSDGLIYPPVDELQKVSIKVAARVLDQALKEGVCDREHLRSLDLDDYVRSRLWQDKYLPFVASDNPIQR